MKSWYDGRLTLAIPLEEAQAGHPDIERFCASLQLLEGVPLSHLVCDGDMLPPESLRTFYIDQGWIDSLIDGALSLGRNSSKDIRHDERMHSYLTSRTYETSRTVRARQLSLEIPNTAPSCVRSGLLLRSQLVKGWPGLQVRCLAHGVELDILRLERLTDSIMFCIVNGEITTIEFTEPQESLYFAFSYNPEGKIVRDLVPLEANGLEIPVHFRDNEISGVVDIARLARDMQDALQLDDQQRAAFGSMEFAVEMMCKSTKISIDWKEGGQ